MQIQGGARRHDRAEHDEYAALAALGDTSVPTLLLNEDYTGLKAYLGDRADDLSDSGLEDRREEYGVGVGVGMLTYRKQCLTLQTQGMMIP